MVFEVIEFAIDLVLNICLLCGKGRKKVDDSEKGKYIFSSKNVNKQLLYVPIVYIIGDETMEPYSAGFDYKEPIEEKSDVKIGVE